MKTNFLVMAVGGLMMSLTSSCDNVKGNVKVEEGIDKDEIKSEILAMESAYADALNIGDANAAAAYYADDAHSFHYGEALEGKPAIIESLKKDIAEVPAGSKVSFITNEILPSSDGNQVVEIGQYTVANSSSPSAATGNFIAVFEKRDGKYVCVRDIAVTDQAKK